MSRILGLALIGGAGLYAYQQGWLDDALASVAPAVSEVMGSEASVEPANFHLQNSAAQVFSIEEKAIHDNWDYIHAFARKNVALTSAIMWQERGGSGKPHKLNPEVTGPVIKLGKNRGDRAQGMMQVMPKTAVWLHDIRGFKLMEPTNETLRTTAGGLYFGTAYLQYLNDIRNGRSEEWIIRSYNGGPGHTALKAGTSNKKQNDGYYAAVSKRKEQLLGKAA